MDDRLLKEYTKEVLNELRLKRRSRYGDSDDGFFTSLVKKIFDFDDDPSEKISKTTKRKENSNFYSLWSRVSSTGKSSVKDLIEDWIEEIEDLEEKDLDRSLKKHLEQYAKSAYQKYLKKYRGQHSKAYDMTKRALDIKYAKLSRSVD